MTTVGLKPKDLLAFTACGPQSRLRASLPEEIFRNRPATPSSGRVTNQRRIGCSWTRMF